MSKPVNSLIVISDIHAGCKLGLCPSDGVRLDDGGEYLPSKQQVEVWSYWQEFWEDWVPMVTKGEPFSVVNNGDSLDGVHHNAVTQISNNLTDQSRIAEKILKPVVEKCEGRYYHIRGTEAHVGKSAQYEEKLAEDVGAKPSDTGQYARWDMWYRLGESRALCHFSHHIGGTGSSSYESTGVYKEMVEAFNEAGRWHDEPPDVVARAHRHRQFETRIATKKGYGISLVTPGWQLRTPFTFRLASGRAGTPQFGGYIIRCGDRDEIFTRFKVWKIERSREVESDEF